METTSKFVGRFIALVGLLAVFAISAGCFGSGESDSKTSQKGAASGKKTTKQAVEKGSAKKSAESANEASPEPDRPPGWSVEVTGPVQTKVTGESILRKYATNTATAEQIVLAGTPFDDSKGSGRLTFTVTGLSETGPGTYNAKRAVATFDDPGVTCELVSGSNSGKTELQVEVTRDSNIFKGTFEGTLECEPAEEGEEPRYVQVKGSFLDY